MKSRALFCMLLGSVVIAFGADCDSSAIRIDAAAGQLTIVNTSSKPIVAYVLANAETRSGDGTPATTFSGVFTGKDALAPRRSFDVGKIDSRPKSILVDYVRFADGSTCGSVTTQQAKDIVARFRPR